ncbi:MAG: substrate-binding domain-containing protein [Anaerolineae bacterium]|nr:substrate-binding domain-containing protein [Anaerolineae bacterium]
MRRSVWLVCLLFWVLWSAVACEAVERIVPTPTPLAMTVTPQVLRVVTAESIAPALQVLASTYQRYHPTAQVSLLMRADTLALDALHDGYVEVAAVTWLPATTPAELWEKPFARDGLAVIVHPQNGLPGLTLEQLQTLFQGQLEDWASWGGLPGTPVVISRETEAGEYALFQSYVMHDARVTLTALLAPSSEAMIQLVSSTPMAVGYVSTTRVDGQVRSLAVAGVPPTPETLAAALYPLTRDLFLVTRGEPQGEARAFIQWILGPEGQEVLTAQRLVPYTTQD